MSSASGLCVLCNTAVAKYKCPTCRTPYCSLVCYKPHKLSHENGTYVPPTAAVAAAPPPPNSAASAITTEDEKKHKFASILQDPEVLARLAASPRLRLKMREVARTATRVEQGGGMVDKELERAKEVLNGMRENLEVEEFMERVLVVLEEGKKEKETA